MLQLRLSATESEDGLIVTLSRRPDGSLEPARELAEGRLSHAFSTLSRELRTQLSLAKGTALIGASLRDLSTRLGADALPDEVRCELLELCRRSNQEIRLFFESPESGAPSAAAWRSLPWEVLPLGNEMPPPGDEALDAAVGRMPNVQIIRVVHGHSPDAEAVLRNLRVLIAHADPATPSFPPLFSAEKEARDVAEATGLSPNVRLVLNATPGALRREMEEFRPTVLHFVGHGYDSSDGGGVVLQGAREGEEERLPASECAQWMGQAGVRICVTSCCWSAARPSSILYEVVRGGITAAIGSQFTWRDSAGRLFAFAVYGALAKGSSIAEAVTLGRQALLGMGTDWAAPVLVTGSEADAEMRLAKSTAPFTVPFQETLDFEGRGEDLERIRHTFKAEPQRPVAIVGIGGIGKTSLAVNAAHHFRDNFPGGVYWINARDTASLAAGFGQVAELLGIPSDLSLDERSGAVKKKLAEMARPSLVILDNLSDGRLIAAIGGHCRLLATTRERKDAPPGSVMVEPDRLSSSEGTAILRRYAPDAKGNSERVVDLVGGLPLAVSLAARYIQRTGLAFDEYADRLSAHRQKTLEAARGSFMSTTGHDGRIFDAIDMSWRELEPFAQRVLTGACCFAGRGIPRKLLEGICSPEDALAFDGAIGDLWDHSLIKFEETGRLSIHELVRVHVRGQSQVGGGPELASASARLLTPLLRRANDVMDWRAIRQEFAHCREIIDTCRLWNCEAEMCALALEYGVAEHGVGELHWASVYLGDALDTAAKIYGREHSLSAEALSHFAEVRQDLGSAEEALRFAREGLVIGLRCAGADTPLVGDLENSLGYVLRMQGKLEEALPHYNAALQIRIRCFGEPSLPVCISLNNIGALAEARGDFDEALTHLRRSANGTQLLFGDHHQLYGALLNSTGRVLKKLGRCNEAVNAHRSAHKIFQEIYGPKHIHSAMSLVFWAEALIGSNDQQSALLGEEGLAILQELYGKDHRVYVAATRRLDAGRQD